MMGAGKTTVGRLLAKRLKRSFYDTDEEIERRCGVRIPVIFDIEGEGQWFVDVKDGTLSVSEGGGDADATISTSAETFEKIMAGEQNPTTAYMTGKLKIKGDMGAAMKLQKLF